MVPSLITYGPSEPQLNHNSKKALPKVLYDWDSLKDWPKEVHIYYIRLPKNHLIINVSIHIKLLCNGQDFVNIIDMLHCKAPFVRVSHDYYVAIIKISPSCSSSLSWSNKHKEYSCKWNESLKTSEKYAKMNTNLSQFFSRRRFKSSFSGKGQN